MGVLAEVLEDLLGTGRSRRRTPSPCGKHAVRPQRWPGPGRWSARDCASSAEIELPRCTHGSGVENSAPEEWREHASRVLDSSALAIHRSLRRSSPVTMQRMGMEPQVARPCAAWRSPPSCAPRRFLVHAARSSNARPPRKQVEDHFPKVEQMPHPARGQPGTRRSGSASAERAPSACRSTRGLGESPVTGTMAIAHDRQVARGRTYAHVHVAAEKPVRQHTSNASRVALGCSAWAQSVGLAIVLENVRTTRRLPRRKRL